MILRDFAQNTFFKLGLLLQIVKCVMLFTMQNALENLMFLQKLFFNLTDNLKCLNFSLNENQCVKLFQARALTPLQ